MSNKLLMQGLAKNQKEVIAMHDEAASVMKSLETRCPARPAPLWATS